MQLLLLAIISDVHKQPLNGISFPLHPFFGLPASIDSSMMHYEDAMCVLSASNAMEVHAS